MALKTGGASGIASADKINNGVWVHLDLPKRDPETGTPIPAYLDPEAKRQPMRVRVRSYRCRAVKQAEDRAQKTGIVKMRVAKKADKEQAFAEASILPPRQFFGLVLAAVDNFDPDTPGVQEVSTDDAMVVVFDDDSMDWIVSQVRDAAYDDELFLGAEEIEVEKAAAGNGSPEKAPKPTPAPKPESEATT